MDEGGAEPNRRFRRTQSMLMGTRIVRPLTRVFSAAAAMACHWLTVSLADAASRIDFPDLGAAALADGDLIEVGE